MELITKTLEKRFAQVGTQSQNPNPIVVAKFYNSVSKQVWYVTEYDKETQLGLAYVTGRDWKGWGGFSMKALEKRKQRLGFGVKRDIHFKEAYLKELIKEQEHER
jgi:Protein of unknown function (DUF2958)